MTVLTIIRRAAVVLMLCAGTAFAQTAASPIDYDAWTRLAGRAETVIDAARASTSAFEELRAQLVEARARFTSAQNNNADRIKTVQEQIAALGPAPADGATEPAEIATRRSELNEQLAKAQAPVLRAEEAFRRADGLVREIDAIIRDRQTEELLELAPSPLAPTALADTVTALTATALSASGEVVTAWNSPTRMAEVENVLLRTMLYLLLAVVVVLRGRMWMVRLTNWLTEASRIRRGQAVAAFLASLGQIVVPFVGILMLVQAVTTTGLLGARGGFLLDLLPQIALIFFSVRWLGSQVFSDHAPLLSLTALQRREGRLYTTVLGLVQGLFLASSELISFESYTPAASSVLRASLIALAAVMLLRMAMILMAHTRNATAEAAERREEGEPPAGASLRDVVLRTVGQAGIAISVLAPLAASAGYVKLGGALVFPALQTLAILGLLAVLNRLTREVYSAIRGIDAEAAHESLVPVLVDFVFGLLALPLLALAWGARVSDLTELWTAFLSGVSIGGAQISPASFLTFAAVFSALYVATRLLQGVLRSTVLPKTKIKLGGQNALVSGLGYVGVFTAAVAAITAAGIDLSNLALVAGALSVGIGFGLQTIVSNFVSGIILLIERPVAEGDWIEVNGTMGIVKDISVRSTRIETFDRTDVILPNADLISGAVTNYTREANMSGRIILSVGVAYGTDTRRVEEILREIAEAHPMVSLAQPPLIVFMAFGASSLDFEIRCILRDVTFGMKVRNEINHQIAERFAKEGIEIPFAQQDVWLRNPETLRAPTAEGKA